MGEVHSFREQLHFSQRASCENFWQSVYTRAFPDMEWQKPCNGDSPGQRLGIDRVIYLSSGRTLYVDEKKRRVFRDDIALETVSNTSTGAPGWMNKSLQIDYLAYAFMDRELVHLFPWDMLRRAWLHFRDTWSQRAARKTPGYRVIEAQNPGYKTVCLCVPIDVVRNAVQLATVIQLPKAEEAAS